MREFILQLYTCVCVCKINVSNEHVANNLFIYAALSYI